jgi:hypothetical protein
LERWNIPFKIRDLTVNSANVVAHLRPKTRAFSKLGPTGPRRLVAYNKGYHHKEKRLMYIFIMVVMVISFFSNNEKKDVKVEGGNEFSLARRMM